MKVLTTSGVKEGYAFTGNTSLAAALKNVKGVYFEVFNNAPRGWILCELDEKDWRKAPLAFVKTANGVTLSDILLEEPLPVATIIV